VVVRPGADAAHRPLGHLSRGARQPPVAVARSCRSVAHSTPHQADSCQPPINFCHRN
jgi:hypothetical protein